MTKTKLEQLQGRGGESVTTAQETRPEETDDEDEAQATYYDEDEKEVEPDILEVREACRPDHRRAAVTRGASTRRRPQSASASAGQACSYPLTNLSAGF